MHLGNAFHSLNVKSIKQVNLEVGYKLINYLKDHTKNGNNSINKILNYLKKVMTHYKIITTFFELPKLPKDTRPFQRFFDDDIRRIMNYTKDLNTSKNSIVYKAFVRLLLDSGLRVSEALSIKLTDIDFTNNLINIWSGKTRKSRYAPFSEFSRPYILELMNNSLTKEHLFFNFLRNRPMNKNDIKLFYRYLKSKLSIDRIHTHRFRKTFASKLTENGLNIEDLQRLFNHSRIETTIKYVQHSEKRSLDEYKKHSNWGID
ncbi:phage integrase family protein [Acholeplasma equirhinis]|uniref:tyrosine-type recombinase/integrase n=1 Tax=Acholeplasma equirhinis TaxID=555393 RepID=UPI00197ABA44|nr:site-specific integrase [Acholeplasma equirhinis]MBN3490166.1 phage integrase family protein [Acholeplasma equirhinis]